MRRNLTQEQLAEHTGIDRRQLQRIEAGMANPSMEMLGRLRRALACGWGELDNPQPSPAPDDSFPAHEARRSGPHPRGSLPDLRTSRRDLHGWTWSAAEAFLNAAPLTVESGMEPAPFSKENSHERLLELQHLPVCPASGRFPA